MESPPDVIASLQPEAVVVVCDGKKGSLYSAAAQVLATVATDESEIQYLDDPNWSQFPEVGAVLKTIAPEEQCFQIAIHTGLGVWAVGVGGRSPNRTKATKLALAT